MRTLVRSHTLYSLGKDSFAYVSLDFVVLQEHIAKSQAWGKWFGDKNEASIFEL